MKFSDAMKALKEGERVRVKRWEKDKFISDECTPEEYWPITRVDTREEWELFQEPKEKMLSFQEALKKIKQGLKVKRKNWHEGFVMSMEKSTGYLTSSQSTVFPEDFEANDWIVTEK